MIERFKRDKSEIMNLYYMEKIAKLEKDLRLSYIPQPELKSMVKIFASVIENLNELQILDVPHASLRERLTFYYNLFLKQNLVNWNTVFFKKFDAMGLSTWEDLKVDLLEESKKEQAIVSQDSPLKCF
jgi:hypothetical protein